MDSEKFKKLTLKRELQRNDILKLIRHKQTLIGESSWLTEGVIENLEDILNDAFIDAQVANLSEFLVENIKDGLYGVLGRECVEPHFTDDAKFRIQALIREMFEDSTKLFEDSKYGTFGRDILDAYNENLVSKENVYADSHKYIPDDHDDDAKESEPKADSSVGSIVMAVVGALKSTNGVVPKESAHTQSVYLDRRYFMRLFSDRECEHELVHEVYKPICCDDLFEDYVTVLLPNCKEKISVQGFDILDALNGRRYICTAEFNKYSQSYPFQDGVSHLRIYVPTLELRLGRISAYKACDELDYAARQANIALCKGFMK